MIPSVVATQVRNCVSDYLHTTFHPTTPGFEGLIDRFLTHPENICRGPYLSIGLPFRRGTSGSNYFPDIPLGFTPHLHQERAFRRLSPPYYQSTLIATGTGSGKTECFLLPILEHCRQQQGELGIKAILIYPMNALATDQAKRIAELIYNTPSLRGKITAGLYIGDQDETPTSVMVADKIITDKRIIRESPPDLLLTNYKMLDYLLVQPDTQKLWSYNQPETLRYLVVDEFHTFDGAQGTDLACLLRRLKHRLQTPTNYLACVGTSATLGNNASETEMLHYAATIFQEPFPAGALIEEDCLSAAEFLQDALLNVLPVPGVDAIAQLNPDAYTTPEAYLRAQAQLWLQDHTPVERRSHAESADLPLNNEWRIQLGEELKTLPIIHNLIRLLQQKTRTYSELVEELRKRLHLPKLTTTESDRPDYYSLLLDSLLSLVAVARRSIQRPNAPDLILPWVNLRVQLWFRELKRMVASVKAQPELLFSDDLTPEELRKTLPVMHCRDCGATGWGGVKPSQGSHRLVTSDLKRFYHEYFQHKPLLTFVFPADETEPDPRKFCGHCLTLNTAKVTECITCGNSELLRVSVPNILYEITRNEQKILTASLDCPFCGSSNGLSILGAQAASLTSAMIGVLFTTPFNRDKKLLTFSDSVQDAAHRAGFYGARTYRTTLRTAIAHSVATHTHPLTLQTLVDQFPDHWRTQLGSAGNYVATFLPTDLEWLSEWDQFLHSDRDDLPADSTLPHIVNQRLIWEIVTQFGHRSAVGPSLERSGSCATYFDPQCLETAIATLHLKLTNEIDALRPVKRDRIRQFLLGLLHHLRQKGGILQPATEQYISQGGNIFRLQHPLYMPSLGPRIPTPSFYVNAAAKADKFERVLQPGTGSSWCENWTSRIFAADTLLLKEQLLEVLHTTLDTLVDAGLLNMKFCGNGRAWGIPMPVLYLEAGGTVLACDRCSHPLTAATSEQPSLTGMTCLKTNCIGHYRPDSRTGLAYYRQLYRGGEVRRIVATEHTGLLARTNREWLEQRFIHSDRRCDPNLLSATSTLEMGINIGDLSTVLLCSVPPTAANFQQRIGRAGRTDGNALVGTVANGTPHDLFFYADPTRMLAGSVEAAACYLDAAAILQRQLTAFCLDNWVATGITKREFPPLLNDVLNALERQDQTRFPYNWLTFIQERQRELLTLFLSLFDGNVEARSRQQLQQFMEQGVENEGGLGWRILDRLEGVRKERSRLSSQIKAIANKLKEFQAKPEALQESDRLAELERERAGFRELMRSLNDKPILNFFTDEGLLPNYAFPEAGVTLRSILWRVRSQSESKDGKKYETFTLTYERPGALAIRELVPSGVFYAEGRQVKIDQIDLKLSEPENWRICRSCNYAVRAIQPEAHSRTCPRCGDTMWSDQGRVRRMLRLRQVMASTSDRKSRFGDDSEGRNTAFFQRHLLVDFAPEYREKTFLIQDKDFPFGIEYICRTSFREVNLGESLTSGETVEMAGRRFTTQGFQVCCSCGKVQRENAKDPSKDHTITCQWRDKTEQAKALDVLYLYREFESEAIRLLMPDENFWTHKGLHSFIAALQLGLKRKFGGKVDHLHTVISEEPQPNSSLRKSFLYLFDSIPGGTGYLRQLIHNPEEVRDVFQGALRVLRACECKDGCYNCLFAYRNSFDQDETSRLTAVRLLSTLEKHWSNLQETSEGLSAIRLNSNFESELERRFIEAIHRYNGKVYNGSSPILRKEIINGRAAYYLKIGDASWTIETQVSLSQQQGVDIPSRADFIIRPASSRMNSLPVVIFTDGWEYHQERLSEDFQQRMAILRSGQFWCWSLTWDDVTAQIETQKPVHRTNGLITSFNSQQMLQVYQQYQCTSMVSLEDLDSFEWLMFYLSQPNLNQWQRWALLRTAVQVKTKLSPEAQNQWFDQVVSSTSQEAIDLWYSTPQNLLVITPISSVLTLWSAINPQRHQQLDPTGSFVLLRLDDTPPEDPGLLRRNWVEALRLFNLYQFLPHTYAVTTTGLDQSIKPLLPKVFATSTPVQKTAQDEQWEQIRQLMVEDQLITALNSMSQEGWPLPEVGYELMSDRNIVIATAELAWVTQQIAVTPTAEDRNIFAIAGWSAWTIEDFLPSMNLIGHKLKGN